MFEDWKEILGAKTTKAGPGNKVLISRPPISSHLLCLILAQHREGKRLMRNTFISTNLLENRPSPPAEPASSPSEGRFPAWLGANCGKLVSITVANDSHFHSRGAIIAQSSLQTHYFMAIFQKEGSEVGRVRVLTEHWTETAPHRAQILP